MIQVLLVIHVIITVALVITILLQRSSADGLAGIGGGGGNFMTGRGAANALSKTTAILATLFIINSLVLAVSSSHTKREVSIADKIISENIKPDNGGEEVNQEVKQEAGQQKKQETEPAVPFAQ